MKTLDEVRTELWEAGQKYAKACIELGLSQEITVEKFISSSSHIDIDEDTLVIIKCSIALVY